MINLREELMSDHSANYLVTQVASYTFIREEEIDVLNLNSIHTQNLNQNS